MSKLEMLGIPPERPEIRGKFQDGGFSNLRPSPFITAGQHGTQIPNYLRSLHLVKKTEEKRDPMDEGSAAARERKCVGG